MASNLKSSYTFKADIVLPNKAEIKKSGTDTKLAKKAITTGCLRASNTVEAELPSALTRALESNVWGPFNPKQPYARKNGEIVGSGNRDIIDTGRLHDSLSITTKFLTTKTQTVIKYNSPYAQITHEGGAITPYGNPLNGTVVLPARPWIRDTLSGEGAVPHYNYRQVYQNEISNAWSEI